MVTYWKRNSNPNLESMMLDTNADKINRFEYPEILECLPDLDGKRILELGAGIGFVSCRCETEENTLRSLDVSPRPSHN